jgi:ribonuclease D
VKLYKDFGVRMQNLVELSYMSRQADKTLRLGGNLHGKKYISLQKLVEGYLDKHLLKDEARLSDWERVLSNKQLECGRLLQLKRRL